MLHKINTQTADNLLQTEQNGCDLTVHAMLSNTWQCTIHIIMSTKTHNIQYLIQYGRFGQIREIQQTR